MAAGIDGKIKLQAVELPELEDARQKAWMNECAAVTDKLARMQEPEQLGEKSVCHVEEDAWQLSRRSTETKPSSKTSKRSTACRGSTWLREPRVRRRVNPRLGGKPDLEYGRFGEYIRQLEERWAKLEDRHKAHVEAEIESRATQWRDYMVERQRVLDDDRASMVEQITAGSKKLKQGFETHAENLKDLMAQSCRPGMARLTDLEEKAEELESQRDMEDRVNKLDTLISDRLESQLKSAMGDRTHIYDELRKLNDEAKNQSDGMRELEKKLEEQADELRADLKCREKVTIGLVLKHVPEKGEAPTVKAENRRR